MIRQRGRGWKSQEAIDPDCPFCSPDHVDTPLSGRGSSRIVPNKAFACFFLDERETFHGIQSGILFHQMESNENSLFNAYATFFVLFCLFEIS
ncbi:hypothetical protein CDAR_538991 [Caerostris darwini]|uniref:Uncharacterized protein n=1 Tax=Caerostris darwini TaxID=1538125 RepID=A0AAV4T3R7_9ARAC|nr:hypothetical protein CDAR_538991 [Caerostris darwini]